MKRPNENVAKHSPKRQCHQKTKTNPWGCPLQGLYFLKEKEIYELSSDEYFSSVKITKNVS
jgi:hypothetical protein